MKTRVAPIDVFEYIIRETERQYGEVHEVRGMLSAWQFAWSVDPEAITNEDILTIGYMIKVEPALHHYRRIPVIVGLSTPPHWADVPRLMQTLLENQDADTDGWIKQFLEIHPFADGNGRCASLLRNIRERTLLHPTDLPHYKFPGDFYDPDGPHEEIPAL